MLRSMGLVLLALVASYGTAHAQSSTFVHVSAAGSHNCGLRADGSVECWGLSAMGRLRVPPGRYGQVDADNSQACGILLDGSLRCWGTSMSGATAPPQTTAAEGRYLQVSVGGYAACAVRADHRLVCWGGRSNLGVFARAGGPSFGAEVVQDIPSGEFQQVSVAHQHACALTREGRVRCWGSDRGGRLDAPDGAFVQVSVGSSHACARRAQGQVVCWGSRNESPPNDTRFATISAGGYGTCGVVSTDRSLVCWGGGFAAQNEAPSEGRFADVSVSGALSEPHACAIRADGSAVCWGRGAGASSPE